MSALTYIVLQDWMDRVYSLALRISVTLLLFSGINSLEAKNRCGHYFRTCLGVKNIYLLNVFSNTTYFWFKLKLNIIYSLYSRLFWYCNVFYNTRTDQFIFIYSFIFYFSFPFRRISRCLGWKIFIYNRSYRLFRYHWENMAFSHIGHSTIKQVAL